MKLTQCERFKNHYYDSDKYSYCPHCSCLGVGGSSRFGLFSKPAPMMEHNEPDSNDYADEKTVMLTQMLDKESDVSQEGEKSALSSENYGEPLSLSGSVAELKTVAMYGFNEEIHPVVGWLVQFSGEEKGRSFTLKSGKNTIGRNGDKTLDVSIDSDLTISRGVQALLIFDAKNTKFLIQTTDGSSLIYLNDNLVMTFSELNAYDRITIGETNLIFVPFCNEEVHW